MNVCNGCGKLYSEDNNRLSTPYSGLCGTCHLKGVN